MENGKDRIIDRFTLPLEVAEELAVITGSHFDFRHRSIMDRFEIEEMIHLLQRTRADGAIEQGDALIDGLNCLLEMITRTFLDEVRMRHGDARTAFMIEINGGVGSQSSNELRFTLIREHISKSRDSVHVRTSECDIALSQKMRDEGIDLGIRVP